MIGKGMSPILVELEEALWEYEAAKLGQPNFTDKAFQATIKIFMAAMMDKMWNLQQNENIELKDRCAMAKELGEKIRKIIKDYTNVDTHTFYK